MKAASGSLDGYRGFNLQLLKFIGNVNSPLPPPQRGTSGEQQIKSPIADEAYVSYVG